MIEDTFVIDGVAHGVDLSEDNWRDPAVGAPFAQHGYEGLHAKWVPPGEPEWIMERQRYLSGEPADPEVLAHAFFAESWTDAVVYHGVPLFGTFKEGLSPLRTGIELRRRYPGRVELFGPVWPLSPNALDEVDRFAELGCKGIKIYPSDVYEGEVHSFRMDDPDVVYPLIERARDRGMKVVSVHKALPLGPVPIDPFKVEDMSDVFLAFPDMWIEVVHGGAAFLEETAMQLGKYSNALVNLEGTSAFLTIMPRKFIDILAAFLVVEAHDRIIWGTGCAAVHPQPLLERFLALEMPRELRDGYGVPELTVEMKRNILGGNIARVLGLDVGQMQRDAADDRFDTAAGDLASPWSGVMRVSAA